MRFLPLVAIALATATFAAACGSGTTSTFNNNGDGGNGGGQPPGDGSAVFNFSDSSSALDSSFSADAFFATDPPPQYCGPDADATSYPTPGGTPECPSDKNREGCPCDTLGETAACWPGLRANRDLGICKDGTTTCQQVNELNKAWGPCTGYVLPEKGATTGAAACKCFSEGQWSIANLSPCFACGDQSCTTVSGALSSYGNPMSPTCTAATMAPSEPWSTDTLKVDCAGEYKLCFELKAGMASAPSASDCSITKVCVDAFYPTANQVFTMPDLPSWYSSDATCAQSFATSGGYAEMSVVGTAVDCDVIDNGSGGPLVFNRIQYCPQSCNSANPPAMCAMCGNGDTGTFGQ